MLHRFRCRGEKIFEGNEVFIGEELFRRPYGLLVFMFSLADSIHWWGIGSSLVGRSAFKIRAITPLILY
jgi:hypothetical protein